LNYYNAEFKLNKKKSGKSGKRTRSTTSIVTLTLISLLLISAPVSLFSTTVFADEPSLSSLFNELGFTNIALSDVETFPSGIYQATLLAEFGGYHNINVLSYYSVGTSDHQTIFTGPEGATGSLGGYVDPPISKIITVDSQFGLSMLAQYRYFTEHWRNPDYPEQHAQVYRNLDSSNMFLIGFEDILGGFDRDYNDIVFSFVQIFPPEIVSVIRSPETPTYDQVVTITAQVTKGSADIASVILSYQIDSASWINVTMNLDEGLYVADIPAQPYNTQINYKVYASDTKGYSDVSTLNSYTAMVPNSSPIAVLNYSPSIVYTAEFVDFDASASYDPDGFIVSYHWDFGDGTNASEATVSHSYVEDGEYLVTLMVVDNDGLVGSKVAIQVVKNRPPVANLTETESIINEKEAVSFDASPSYDADGTIISYTWGFGDGTAATGITVTHSYADTGFYTVTLTVSDDDGATDECKHSLQVTKVVNSSPVASFTVTAETVNIDETLSFDASESYDSDGTIVAYSWDFGDGTATTGVTVEHAYSEAGTYTVTLTVTDNDGVTDTTTATISVITPQAPNQSPVASFTESAQTVSIGESIHFDGSESYDPDGSVVSYTWDFGDGTTATGIEVDHTYENDGVYTITLTVMDADAATDDATRSVTVTKTVVNISPVALFTKSAETVFSGESIHFDASESYDSDGTIVAYSWDFGDGTATTGVTVEHAYSEAGTYTVTLTVTDNDGASSLVVAETIVETETTISLAIISGIGLGITALTAALLYVFLIRRKKSKQSEDI
jgi:PKD repeat protein